MGEVQIKIEVQDGNGQVKKRAALAVPEDITREELLGAVSSKYSSIVDKRSSLLIDWSTGKPASTRLVTDGTLVIVRPRSSGVRWLDEE